MKIHSLHKKLFVAASIALLAMNTYGMDGAKAGSADGKQGYGSQENLSKQITQKAETCFSDSWLQAMLKSSPEATNTFRRLKIVRATLTQTMEAGDKEFEQAETTPGYSHLKKKLLTWIESFETATEETTNPLKKQRSSEEVLNDIAKILKRKETLKDKASTIKAAQTTSLEASQSEVDRAFAPFAEAIQKKVEGNFDSLKKTELDNAKKKNKSEEEIAALTDEEIRRRSIKKETDKLLDRIKDRIKKNASAQTAEAAYLKLYNDHRDLGILLSFKRIYFELLCEAQALNDTTVRSALPEDPAMGLTFAEAQTYRDDQDKKHAEERRKTLLALAKKINSTPEEEHAHDKVVFNRGLRELQILSSDAASDLTEYPQEKLLTSITNNICGTLYELEAGLLAKQHGKTIIAFGPEIKLFFNAGKKPEKQTNPCRYTELTTEFAKHPYLSPEETTLPNGDVVFMLKQEFDLVSDVLIECKCTENVSAYVDNLKRQQYMSKKLGEADKVEVSSGENFEIFSEENSVTNHMSNKPVVCYAKTAEDFLKREAALQKEFAKEKTYEERLAALVSRTRSEGRHRERLIAEAGFSLWNGDTYRYTLAIASAYHQRPSLQELTAIKKAIKSIDNKAVILTILGQPRHRAKILQHFKDLANIYPATAKPALRRSMSSPQLSLEMSGRTNKASTAVIQTQKAILNDPLGFLREPLPVRDIVMIDEDGTVYDSMFDKLSKEPPLSPQRDKKKTPDAETALNTSPICDRRIVESRFQKGILTPKIARAYPHYNKSPVKPQEQPAIGENAEPVAPLIADCKPIQQPKFDDTDETY